MPVRCGEEIKVDAGEGEEQCDPVARSALVPIAIYLAIIVLAVVLAIGVVELWRWVK